MFNSQSSSLQPLHNDTHHRLSQPRANAFFDECINDMNSGSFSGGSPLLYPLYEYSFLPAGAAQSSPRMTTSNATDVAIAPPPSRIALHTEPSQDPPQSRRWMPVPAQVHADPTLNDAYRLSIANKKSCAVNQDHPHNGSPSSSSMAVLIHSDTLSRTSPSHLLPSSPGVGSEARRSPARSEATDAHGSTTNNRVREKKHGCWMCHKSFDRPSTLRKHLLVHTGEKPFVCETCGRRFSVASNLNRHVRRCILRPVNSPTSPPVTNTGVDATAVLPSRAPTSQENDKAQVSPITAIASERELTSPNHAKIKRTRLLPTTAVLSNLNSLPQQRSALLESKRPTAKRRRRAPSQTPWIPLSLLAYDLNPVEFHKSTPVPLPPVSPSTGGRWIEERDSWDENVGLSPYSRDWIGKLPGPGLGIGVGLGGRDVGNLGGSAGGYFMGRLSLF